ncbi:hypothetical protein [Dactylosporangium sp. CS-033363]
MPFHAFGPSADDLARAMGVELDEDDLRRVAELLGHPVTQIFAHY